MLPRRACFGAAEKLPGADMNASRLQEREIAFETCAASARQVPAALRKLGWPIHDRGLRRIRDHYYDTTDLTLYQAGVALRLRENRSNSELTLKTISTRTGADGLNRRLEISQDAGRTGAGARRLAATVLGRQAAEILEGRALREILVLAQKRHVFDLECPKGGLVQVSVDCVTAPGALIKKCWRVEAELIRGPVRRVRSVARHLQRTLRLSAATASKLESALVQTGRTLPRPPMDDVPPVAAADPFGIVGGRILLLHLHRLRWFAPGVLLGVNPEPLHRMHTTVRRLRTALLVFGPALPARAVKAVNADLRWLGGVLSRARDGDVQTDLLDRESAAGGGAPDGMKLYREWMAQERAEAQRAVRRALATGRSARLLERMQRLAETAAASAGGAAFGAQAVAKVGPPLIRTAWRKVIRRGRRTQSHARDDDALHKVRISCKRLRYLCEFLGAGSGIPASGRLAARATALQDCLGAQQDAAIAGRWMHKFLHDAGQLDDFQRAALIGQIRRLAEQRRLLRKQFACLWRRFDRRKHAP